METPRTFDCPYCGKPDCPDDDRDAIPLGDMTASKAIYELTIMRKHSEALLALQKECATMARPSDRSHLAVSRLENEIGALQYAITSLNISEALREISGCAEEDYDRALAEVESKGERESSRETL